MGKKALKWNGTYAAVLLGSHSTPTLHFRTLCLNLPVKKSRKTIITQKVLVAQSSNIAHCDWHTSKPICIKFQVFSNTFSLFKLIFFIFSWAVRQTAKNLTFCWFWLGKMYQNGLSGMYIGLEVCQIQWCWFWDSMISCSWESNISGEKWHKMEWRFGSEKVLFSYHLRCGMSFGLKAGGSKCTNINAIESTFLNLFTWPLPMFCMWWIQLLICRWFPTFLKTKCN